MYHIEVGVDTNSETIEDKQVNQTINNSLIFTLSGKEAINILLSSLKLQLDDEIYITSTFGAKYVSKCVTCSIFNHCQPSKILTSNTKIIYIIHEFGVPHPETQELLKYAKSNNLIVVEDCAHSNNSYFDSNIQIGSLGDFVIYSLKKIFPMKNGGLLKINNENYLKKISKPQKSLSYQKVENLYWNFIENNELYTELRKQNYIYLQKNINAKSHFELNGTISPYLFSIQIPKYSQFREKFNQNFEFEFECVNWFGLDIVSFPIHHFLTLNDLDRLIIMINNTIKEIE